ncbi:MAG: hypothetical protein WAM60_26575 [Candidatus Promineifilaceae bacterium]
MRIGQIQDGDLVVDMRLFPSRLYKFDKDTDLKDITADSLPNPDHWKTASSWFSDFTQKSRLQELLSIEGYGFWWANNCLKFIPALNECGNLFSWIDLLKQVEEVYQPGEVTIYGRHSSIHRIATQIWIESNIQIVSKKENENKGKKLPERIISLVLVRFFIGVVSIIYILLRRPEIVFFSTTNLLRQKGVGSDKKVIDIYLDDIAKALRTKGKSTIFVEKYGWNASWPGLRARGLFFPNDLFFLLASPGFLKLGFVGKLAPKWQRIWRENRDAIVQQMVYRDIDLAFVLEPLVKKEFIDFAPSLECLVKIWHRFFSLWKPKLLYINCSYCLSSLAGIVAAKQLSIPTIELQHGAISNNNTAYLIPPYISQQYSHLCDKMTVWGERIVRLFVGNGIYEPEQLVVCGSPRIDWLLGELPPRDVTLSFLSIPPESRIVLYTSNMLAEGLMGDILDSIKHTPQFEDVVWIIKLHPREKTRQIWDEAIQARQLSRVIVVESELDFYALLAACDVHISLASTTLLESAILGKLNIGFRLDTLPDPAGYAEANAFYPVVPDQLGRVVNRAFQDSEWAAALLSEQSEFATDWCKHDGKAVDCIVEFIGQFT